MSHVKRTQVYVVNLVAFSAACQQLGAEFVKDQKSHHYYAGSSAECEHAVKVPGTDTEVGLVKRHDDKPGFELQWDTYGKAGNRLVEVLGPGMANLKKEYAAQVGMQELRAKGFRPVRSLGADGKLRVVATR